MSRRKGSPVVPLLAIAALALIAMKSKQRGFVQAPALTAKSGPPPMTFDPNTSSGLSPDKLSVSEPGFGRAPLGRSAGKFYFEVRVEAGGQVSHTPGLTREAASTSLNTAKGAGVFISGGELTGAGGSSTSSGSIWSAPYQAVGTVWGFAIDLGTGKVWMSRNGQWNRDTAGNAGNPVTGSNPRHTVPAGTYYPFVGFGRYGAGAATESVRFNLEAMEYGPPAGFTAWAG